MTTASNIPDVQDHLHASTRQLDRPQRRTARHTAPSVIAAAVIAFIVSTAWYIVFAGPRAGYLPAGAAATSTQAPAPWMVAVELGRSLVVGVVIAAALARARITTAAAAAALAVTAWLAFPVTLLTGSVVWDGVPLGLAAIHAGDWLIKLTLIAVLVTVWPHRRTAPRPTGNPARRGHPLTQSDLIERK